MLENIAAWINPANDDPAVADANDIWYLELEFNGDIPHQYVAVIHAGQSREQIAQELRWFADKLAAGKPDTLQ